MIRIFPVTPESLAGADRRPHRWVWRCDCHGLASTVPWDEKPSESSALAEHDLLIEGRPPEPRGAPPR